MTAWRRFRKWGADGTFARGWPYLRAEFEHAEKIDFSRHKFECLQIQTDSPQLLIRRSGEREGRKRARSSGSGGPNPQLPGRRMVSFSAKIA